MTARLSRPGRPKAPEICEGSACKAERRPASAAPSVRLAARKGVWQQGGFARALAQRLLSRHTIGTVEGCFRPNPALRRLTQKTLR